VALAKKTKKKKRKKDSGKLAIRPDHPRRRSEVKVCMPGGLWCVVLSSFIKIGPVVLPLWVVEIAIPHYFFAIGLYNSLYYRTSRDIPTGSSLTGASNACGV